MCNVENNNNLIHAVIGPTASGKSAYAIKLAQKLDAEIINVDAYSIYKELDIVSAKVTFEEMQGIKHHFVSFFEIGDVVDIAKFQKLVRLKIDEIISNNKDVILVGGSNLYMQAILFNYEINDQIKYEYPKYENLELREVISILKEIDPMYLKVAQNNKRRMVKAILYNEITGLQYSQKEDKSNTLFYNNVCFYYLDWKRELIYERITIRVKKMFEQGLRAEFENLSKKYPLDNQAFKAIGFSEFIKYDDLNDEEMIALIAQNTRRLAKRQITWIKNKILNNDYLKIEHINLSKNTK